MVWEKLIFGISPKNWEKADLKDKSGRQIWNATDRKHILPQIRKIKHN